MSETAPLRWIEMKAFGQLARWIVVDAGEARLYQQRYFPSFTA
jgi:hypothetical protein